MLSCLSSNFARREEEHISTLNKSSWLNDELIVLLSLSTVTPLGAKGISSEKTEAIMSGSGNTGADNKTSDEEEALG